MQVTVKLYGSFCIERFTSALCDYPAGSTIAAIVEDLGLPAEFVIRLRNGRHAAMETVVQEGDTLSFLPLLDGG